ncbi:spore gernimation protein GerA [Gordoniibacillus kamchatkensis]|uniref:Spore gernimation protein GerA n=1 Tax=Gordoniibacillus kamchatkensis TaxID=1590651 RepID=A0ABR5AHJ4_9BACL|nr:spore germination protein [Paenibacillus sp. VKM B-2647]KIL39822.1 spore gernimation protein GerA [Paenibacillus sp. VKM B-2647]
MNIFRTILQGMLKKPADAANAGQSDMAYEPENVPGVKPTLVHTLYEFQDCMDLTHRAYPEIGVDVLYFGHLVDNHQLAQDVLNPILHIRADEVHMLLRQTQFWPAADSKELIEGILSGQVAIFNGADTYLVNVSGPKERQVSTSESETVITGPHDAFNEQAGACLSLIRKRVKSSHLKVIKLSVGEVTKTDVYILYIQDIANMLYVREAIRRITNIEIDAVHDSNMLIQYIDDNPMSIFPQFLTSERPDAIASKLAAGRVVGIVDGSPSVFSAPTSFFEFFSSSDDYYQRWMLGTATRLLRFLAFGITITFTALYVSVTTYHYEMIPENLLLTIAESRSKVPFPPVYEALLMETTIELLREAGARLPTKIGQTIGIVGGIVIGQAAVQAGLTSNILIIAVASSAIASFVIPSYVMSASIRLIRFGLILLAGLWGNFGLAIALAAIVIHMSGLTSLGSSYLTPVAPFKLEDWRDIFIRAPFGLLVKRPTQAAPPNKVKNKMRR